MYYVLIVIGNYTGIAAISTNGRSAPFQGVDTGSNPVIATKFGSSVVCSPKSVTVAEWFQAADCESAYEGSIPSGHPSFMALSSNG